MPLLERLRVPSPHGSPDAEAAVGDRLRELVVDECVFLPANGLPHRDAAQAIHAQYAQQRAAAVEEGGERRRHFLRVRVGGWDENLVVTVFVRVHTQGGMMMLEVAPHVLLPVDVAFHNADADAQRYRNNNGFGKAVGALRQTPGSIAGLRHHPGPGTGELVADRDRRPRRARTEGPRLSVRELASEDNGSLFHLMDLDRFLKNRSGPGRRRHYRRLARSGLAHRGVRATRRQRRRRRGFIQSVNGSAFSVGGSNNTNTGHHNSGKGKGSSGGN
ncbi:hypothetical protein ACFSNO_27870 [Streptomyces cirratus]